MNCLYLHIPFCRAKCLYCSFSSYSGLDFLHGRYCTALLQEIRSQQSGQLLNTLFVGGGTPTVLSKEQLKMILDTCDEKFGFTVDAEISLEANPGTIDYSGLRFLRSAGFNRISLGVQSFDDRELHKLGRVHDAAMAGKVVIDAQRAGFDNLSLDLMYGLPGQTLQSWRSTLQQALALEPQHLSAYQLSIDEGTGFADLAERDELNLAAEEIIVEMDELTQEISSAAGLDQYEISNFCRPGFACSHNLNYWHNQDYLACGAGAVSCLAGVRARRVEDPMAYCEAIEQGRDAVAESEKLERMASFKETVIMGLRLINGISDQQLRKRYELSLVEVYGKSLDDLSGRGLIHFDGLRLALSAKGRRFANQVMAELV